MRFIKCRGRFEASNVCFYPDSLEGYSYDWWQFTVKYKGKVLFNNCSYSTTTGGHQRKVIHELIDRNIRVHLYLRFTRQGFQHGNVERALKDEIVCTQEEIQDLKDLINKPKTHKKTNERRKETIKELLDHIRAVEVLLSE